MRGELDDDRFAEMLHAAEYEDVAVPALADFEAPADRDEDE